MDDVKLQVRCSCCGRVTDVTGRQTLKVHSRSTGSIQRESRVKCAGSSRPVTTEEIVKHLTFERDCAANAVAHHEEQVVNARAALSSAESAADRVRAEVVAWEAMLARWTLAAAPQTTTLPIDTLPPPRSTHDPAD